MSRMPVLLKVFARDAYRFMPERKASDRSITVWNSGHVVTRQRPVKTPPEVLGASSLFLWRNMWPSSMTKLTWCKRIHIRILRSRCSTAELDSRLTSEKPGKTGRPQHPAQLAHPRPRRITHAARRLNASLSNRDIAGDGRPLLRASYTRFGRRIERGRS
jgi:hypothetical protein